MYKIRYNLAYVFLDWGLRLIPNPYVRARYELAVRTAAETLEFELMKEIADADVQVEFDLRG